MAAEQEAKTRVIDVRTPGEFYFQAPRFPGAELIPLADLPGRAVEWPRDEPLLVVCDDGRRSRLAATWLREHGFRQVQIRVLEPPRLL